METAVRRTRSARQGRQHVGLIAFVFNDLTEAVNPIKLREYLSAGIPVVASALADIRLLEGNPMRRTAHNDDDFIAAVRECLAMPRTPADRQAAATRWSRTGGSAAARRRRGSSRSTRRPSAR